MAGLQRVKATYTREDARGLFVEIVNAGPWETVINGTMRRGAVIGNHYHKRTRCLMFLTSGAARVDVAEVESGSRGSTRLRAREGVCLEPNHAHAIRFEEDSTFVLLKSLPYDENDPDTYPYMVADGCGG